MLLEAIAEAMGQKGTMSALRRTSAGVYTEADAHTLEEILAAKEQGTAALEALMLPVESVFTQGSMRGIERFFGATVDPDRGKPTNRAFLLQASQQIRLDHSLADTRTPNSSELHHSPAAPTRV